MLVDDVTISGEQATQNLLLEVRRVVRRHGLKTRAAKSKFYSATRPKQVTGAIVVGDELKLPNSQHKKIRQTRADLTSADPQRSLALNARLKGQLVAANEVLKHRL